MTQPVTCPACGQHLTADLALAVVPDPNAPVPQPMPAPGPSDLGGQVFAERDGRWVPAGQDPHQVGPDVYAAPGPFGALGPEQLSDPG